MARILIAGCGYVGSELARELVAAGHAVFGLRRRAEGLPAGVRPAAADLTRPDSLRELLRRAHGPRALDVVVYAAAADRAEEDAYRAAYVHGVRNLVAALLEAGERPRRVFLASSTGAYGQSDGSFVDEDSPADPVHWTGRLVLEGERVLARSGLSGTVVRLGGIYGPGRTALIDRVRSGRARCREGAPRYTNRIHRDDAAGLFCYLIELELSGAVLEPLYLGVDEEPADECVVLRWLAARLGVPPPAVAPAAGGDSSRERRSGSKRCRSDRIRRLGYRFRYRSFRDGYAALIDAG